MSSSFFTFMPLKRAGLLETVADALLGALGDGQVGDVLAVQQDLAARRALDAHDELGQRRLAPAVRAGDNREAARRGW